MISYLRKFISETIPVRGLFETIHIGNHAGQAWAEAETKSITCLYRSQVCVAGCRLDAVASAAPVAGCRLEELVLMPWRGPHRSQSIPRRNDSILRSQSIPRRKDSILQSQSMHTICEHFSKMKASRQRFPGDSANAQPILC